MGSPDIEGRIIGPEGHPIDPQTKKMIPKIQHGHAYIQAADLGSNHGALMLGIEGSGPGFKNMFGSVHNAASGSKDSTKETSITGGQKMAVLFGDQAPAQYGGMWITVDHKDFVRLKSLFDKVLALSVDEQKGLFENILGKTGTEAHAYLKEKFPQYYSKD